MGTRTVTEAVQRRLVDRTGAGLVEILVALLTFLVVLAGLGSSVVNARRTEASSRSIGEATTLALDKIEHLRTLLLVHPHALPGTHVDAQNPLAPGGGSGGIYNRTWTVTQDVPLLGMRRAEVSVSWNDRHGPGSVTLVAYLGLS